MVKKFLSLPKFYRIYFSALAVFLILLIIGCIVLSSIISQYNKGIPETVSDNFFNETFMKTDTDKIIEMAGIKANEFETIDVIRGSILDEMNDLSYTSISSDGDIKKYIVKSGEYKVASFTLKPDEKGDYHPDTLELHLSKNTKDTFRVLSGSTLYINGISVSDKYISNKEPHINSSYLPEGTSALEWITYKIDGLSKAPDVKVIDRNGKETSLSEGKDNILTEDIIYDEPEAEIVDRILKGAKQYAICMQEDASKASVYPYFERGTDLYKSFQMVENFFVWDHYAYEIRNEQVSEYMRYDENTVSMRISFEHILKKHGHEDYKDITDITYFARNIDGKYMIFARHNNI